jgi:hypothetical protein
LWRGVIGYSCVFTCSVLLELADPKIKEPSH